MGYRIDIDHTGCINCGVCMDVCPVAALDMTRPGHGGVETGGTGRPLPWLMEYPVQVAECSTRRAGDVAEAIGGGAFRGSGSGFQGSGF